MWSVKSAWPCSHGQIATCGGRFSPLYFNGIKSVAQTEGEATDRRFACRSGMSGGRGPHPRRERLHRFGFSARAGLVGLWLRKAAPRGAEQRAQPAMRLRVVRALVPELVETHFRKLDRRWHDRERQQTRKVLREM